MLGQLFDDLLRRVNSIFLLLKRAKKTLLSPAEKLLHNCNTLVKPLPEYCRIVCENCSNKQLLKLVRFERRCALLILDAEPRDSRKPFSTLNWLSIDDTIRIRKFCMMHKIVNGVCVCPQYFNK